jgi:hypothetical protein
MANRRFIDFPIAASVGNDDIVLIWQDGLNKQTTKATLFAGSPNSLAGLTDVDISALANGQILQYNSTTSKWENVDRTDIDLDQLGDVTIVSPTNGQVLVYNSSTSKWENSSAGFVPYTGAVTTVNLGAQSILAGSFVKAGGTSAQFLKADGSVDSNTYLTTGSAAATYVPYTGATADVNLGTHDLTAERGTFQNNGSSDTLTVNHTSGSGYGIIVTKGGNNEALYVSKTSGSGNAMTVIGGRTSLVDLSLSSVTNTAGDFLTLSGGVVHKRTAAEARTDIGAGTVTSVAALTLGTSGTDLSSTVANGTTTPVITLNVPTASATNRGALSSADWSTFNSKQNALTLTTTGTSGDATLVGSTLNIPNYGSALSGYLPLTGGTLTGALGGTSASFSSVVNTTSVFRLTQASVARGGLYTYNQVLGSGTDYGVGIYSEGEIFLVPGGITTKRFTMATGGDATFSSSVGVGGSPTNRLTALASETGTQITTIPVAKFVNTGNAFSKVVIGSDNANYDGVISMDNNATLANTKLRFYIGNGAGSTAGHSNDQLVIQGNGNVLIGTTDDNSNKLRVNGTIFSDNSVTATSFIRSGGTSAQFLKADGSVDSNTYVTGGPFLPLTGGTLTGALNGTSASFSSVVNTTSIYRITQASVSRGGLYTYNQVLGSGTDYGVGVYSEAEAFIVTGGTTIKRVTISSTGAATFVASLTGTQITTIPVAKFANTGNAFSKVVIGSDNANYDAVISMDNNATLANTKLRFYIGNGAGSTAGHSNDQLVLQGNGNLGINTDSPSSKLQVAGSFALPHTTKSENYTLTATDFTVGFDCASSRTANLPDATTCAGRIYVIYQYNTGIAGSRYVTLDGNGSQTINGLTTFSLQYNYDFASLMIQSTGSNWVVISAAINPAPV